MEYHGISQYHGNYGISWYIPMEYHGILWHINTVITNYYGFAQVYYGISWYIPILWSSQICKKKQKYLNIFGKSIGSSGESTK